MTDTLVDTAAVAARLHDSTLAVIDCRFDLARPEWGAAAFAAAHLPGARYAHLDRDLSGPVGPSSGRHPLPDPQAFAARAAAWGIDAAVDVVAYDQGNGMFASRLWWLLRWLGHTRVAVLDGGFAAWQAAGLPVAATAEPAAAGGAPRRAPAPAPAPDRTRWVSTEDLLAARAAGALVIDARAADRFAGRNETLDAVPGHVPGAINHPFARNLDASGRFLAPSELHALWTATLAGRSPSSVVAMCGSGVTACHNLLALEHAGLPGARLYAGSWSEWIRDPSRPVALGDS